MQSFFSLFECSYEFVIITQMNICRSDGSLVFRFELGTNFHLFSATVLLQFQQSL